eukprot:1693173-Karenia_brevis.AAC.1
MSRPTSLQISEMYSALRMSGAGIFSGIVLSSEMMLVKGVGKYNVDCRGLQSSGTSLNHSA